MSLLSDNIFSLLREKYDPDRLENPEQDKCDPRHVKGESMTIDNAKRKILQKIIDTGKLDDERVLFGLSEGWKIECIPKDRAPTISAQTPLLVYNNSLDDYCFCFFYPLAGSYHQTVAIPPQSAVLLYCGRFFAVMIGHRTNTVVISLKCEPRRPCFLNPNDLKIPTSIPKMPRNTLDLNQFNLRQCHFFKLGAPLDSIYKIDPKDFTDSYIADELPVKDFFVDKDMNEDDIKYYIETQRCQINYLIRKDPSSLTTITPLLSHKQPIFLRDPTETNTDIASRLRRRWNRVKHFSEWIPNFANLALKENRPHLKYSPFRWGSFITTVAPNYPYKFSPRELDVIVCFMLEIAAWLVKVEPWQWIMMSNNQVGMDLLAFFKEQCVIVPENQTIAFITSLLQTCVHLATAHISSFSDISDLIDSGSTNSPPKPLPKKKVPEAEEVNGMDVAIEEEEIKIAKKNKKKKEKEKGKEKEKPKKSRFVELEAEADEDEGGDDYDPMFDEPNTEDEKFINDEEEEEDLDSEEEDTEDEYHRIKEEKKRKLKEKEKKEKKKKDSGEKKSKDEDTPKQKRKYVRKQKNEEKKDVEMKSIEEKKEEVLQRIDTAFKGMEEKITKEIEPKLPAPTVSLSTLVPSKIVPIDLPVIPVPPPPPPVVPKDESFGPAWPVVEAAFKVGCNNADAFLFHFTNPSFTQATRSHSSANVNMAKQILQKLGIDFVDKVNRKNEFHMNIIDDKTQSIMVGLYYHWILKDGKVQPQLSKPQELVGDWIYITIPEHDKEKRDKVWDFCVNSDCINSSFTKSLRS